MLFKVWTEYENKKHIIIMCKNSDYSSTVEADELEVVENGDSIIFDNMEGTNFTIKKGNVRRISLSSIMDSEEINIDLENSNMKLLICD
jgi:uncharacterized Zn finger protein